MLKRAPYLVLVCIEPLKVILLSRRSIKNITNLPMVLKKIVTVKTTEELIQFIDFAIDSLKLNFKHSFSSLTI